MAKSIQQINEQRRYAMELLDQVETILVDIGDCPHAVDYDIHAISMRIAKTIDDSNGVKSSGPYQS